VKPVRVRPLADYDIDGATEYLLAESGAGPAGELLRELEAGFARIGAQPRIGSPRYARLLRGLRFWKVNRFPYLVFYVDQPDHIDVLRVLHASRDLPAALRGSVGEP